MSERRVYAVRGATTLCADTREAVVDGTRVLLEQLLERNGIAHDDVVSIFFTATDDLHAEFPAAAARALGLTGVPMLCARELDVRESPLRVEHCIRVMLHFHGDRRPEPVYLEGAARLLDLVREQEQTGGRGGT